jgi:very-long-chain ceramide synthase
MFISHPVPSSSDDDPRYQKGYLDLVFIGYYIVFYSFVRQIITQTLCRPLGRYFGIKKQAKLDRFGEQGYALVYFSLVGAWGMVSLPSRIWVPRSNQVQVIMSKLPTWWYRTEFFWIGDAF